MQKKKLCPICKKVKDVNIVDACDESFKYVIENIKRQYPQWVEKDGACPMCLEYYKKL